MTHYETLQINSHFHDLSSSLYNYTRQCRSRKVYEHWRNFDGGDFSHDTDGDWEFSDLYEVNEEDMDSFHVDWEQKD